MSAKKRKKKPVKCLLCGAKTRKLKTHIRQFHPQYIGLYQNIERELTEQQLEREKQESQQRQQEHQRREQEQQQREQERQRHEQERQRREQQQRKQERQRREQQQREQERQRHEKERQRREQERQSRWQGALKFKSTELAKEERWEEVVEVCLTWLKHFPRKLGPTSRLAWAYYNLGQLEKAKELYKALSLRTDIAQTARNRYQNLYQKVKLELEQERQRREQEALKLKSTELAKQERWEEVVEVCLTWLKHFPRKLDPTSRLAWAYYNLGQLEKAKELYEALSLRTDIAQAAITRYQNLYQKVKLELEEIEKTPVVPEVLSSPQWYNDYTGIFLMPAIENNESWIARQWRESMAQELLKQDDSLSVEKLKNYRSQCWEEIKTTRRYQIPSRGHAEILTSDRLIQLIDLRKVRFVQEGANAPEVFLRFEFGVRRAAIGVVKVKSDGSVEGFHHSVDSALFQAIIEATALSYYRDLVTPGKVYYYQPGNKSRQARQARRARRAKSKKARRLPRRLGIPISKRPAPSLNVWYEAQERAIHDVVGHKRWIGQDFKADKEKQQQARKAGVELPDGYTWVKKHQRGHLEEQLKLNGTDLTERILFSPPERASRELDNLLS